MTDLAQLISDDERLAEDESAPSPQREAALQRLGGLADYPTGDTLAADGTGSFDADGLFSERQDG